MKHLKFIFFALLIAIFMALLEIEIEGGGGWAANLPTWKINIHLPIVGMWSGYKGKPLTGYHLYLWLFSFFLTHVSFMFSKWTVKKELYLMSFYIIFTTFEGLLWFILNPAFGWNSFRSGNLSWYKEQWILGLPGEYWIRFGVGAMLYWLANENTKIKTFKLQKSKK